MKIKYIIYGLLILGLGALIFYRIDANNETGAKKPLDDTVKATTVRGMVLHTQKFNDNISLSGTIEANEQIEIRSEVSGVVERINFEEGSKVAQGQILFKVNDIELQAQLSKVQTAQRLASENERRAKLLLEKQAISQEEYEIASADFLSAKAESELIAAQLSKTIVRAPFSGTIGLRSISKGTYVTPVTPIAKLVNTNKLKIVFSVPEKYSSQISIGSDLTFTTASSKDEHEAKVYAIEPEVEIATRTLKMRAIAENLDGKLYPGTYANIRLPLESIDNALMVPSESLIPVQNGKRIFISEQGKAKEIDVEIGARTGNEVRILSGLNAGDTILTYGVMSLKNGTPVNITFEASNSIPAE